MKHVLDAGPSRAAWSARYERLRADWLVQEVGWGQALFIRQGMAAWMKAWSAAEPPESATRANSIAPQSDPSRLVAMGGELQRQLTRELANLILHRQQEILA